VDAEFIGLSGSNNNKIRLHKLNGVVIEVPLEKMSAEDIRIIEHMTKRRLHKDSRSGGGESSRRSEGDGHRREHRERREGDSSSHRARPQTDMSAGKRATAPASTKKSETDWFEFFLAAGCDVDDCSRYANNFEKDRIDESILPDLETGTLRSLGMREGDIIRVSKHIKNKYGSTSAGSGTAGGSTRESSQPHPPPTPNKDPAKERQEQMKDDEELARKLQEDLNAGRDGSGLFTNASGGVKNTRRGRPQTNRSGPSAVSFDTITSSLSEASDRSKTPEINRVVSPDTVKEASRRSSSTVPVASGFDDDAWTVKPASKPSTPAPAPAAPALVDTSPAPPAAPAPPPVASPAAMPSSSSQASNAQALTDAYLESIGLGKRPPSAPVNRQTAISPAPQAPAQPPQQQQSYQPSASPNPVQPQQTGYRPSGPVLPIASNQHLLNPLIPTQTGMTGFVPTRNQSSPLPMMPQQTGWQQPQQTGFQQPQQSYQQPQQSYQQPQQAYQQPQPTGFQPSMQYGGGMQPQQTGYPLCELR